METNFSDHLRRFGPAGSPQPITFGEAQRYCSRLARTHYENFTVASWLLPRRLVRHFHNVYAYCRWADDLADDTGGGSRALALLRWWREQLLTCYQGEPRHPVMIALSDTIRMFGIPKQPFLDLLVAFENDQLVKRYRTYDQLLDYCKYSANPVGRLVLYLGETFDEAKAHLSDHICTALQLANFWQDLSRDLDIGRIYLPEEDRHRFNYPDDDLLARRYTASFAALMEFEVGRTRELFHRGSPLIGHVPDKLRIDIDLFVRGGMLVLDKIQEQAYDVWTQRPVSTTGDKFRLLLEALWRRWRSTWLQW